MVYVVLVNVLAVAATAASFQFTDWITSSLWVVIAITFKIMAMLMKQMIEEEDEK